MAIDQLRGLVNQLARRAAGDGGPTTDGHLLERYLAERDE